MTPDPVPALDLDEAVTALAWAPPDGQLWAGTAAGTLTRISRAGHVTRRSDRRRGRIVALAADPASHALASADADGLVVLDDGDGQTDLVALGSRARTVAWSGAGGHLALTSQAAGLLVTDHRGRRVFALPPSRRHRRAVWHGDPDARRLAVVGAGATTWVALAPTLDAAATTSVVPSDEVTVTAASAPGGWLAKGDLRGEIGIANTERGTEARISGWPDPIDQLAWLPGAGHVVVAGGDEVTAWSTATCAGPDDEGTVAEPARTSPDGTPVLQLAPHPWRAEAAVGTEGGTVAVWAPGGGPPLDLPACGAAVSSLAWDPLGETLAIGLRSGRLLLWNPAPHHRERLA